MLAVAQSCVTIMRQSWRSVGRGCGLWWTRQASCCRSRTQTRPQDAGVEAGQNNARVVEDAPTGVQMGETEVFTDGTVFILDYGPGRRGRLTQRGSRDSAVGIMALSSEGWPWIVGCRASRWGYKRGCSDSELHRRGGEGGGGHPAWAEGSGEEERAEGEQKKSACWLLWDLAGRPWLGGHGSLARWEV